jgi:hypothetical protein
MQVMICHRCNSNHGYRVVHHEGDGCGLLNEQREAGDHDHYYCSKCGADRILRRRP